MGFFHLHYHFYLVYNSSLLSLHSSHNLIKCLMINSLILIKESALAFVLHVVNHEIGNQNYTY